MKRSVVRRGVVASVFVMALGLVAGACVATEGGGTPPKCTGKKCTPTSTSGTTLPPQPCDEATQSGGDGVTVTSHELGQTSGTFRLTWNNYTQPDRIDVRYQGAVIFTTGGLVSGTGDEQINFGPGTSTRIEVTVTGGGPGTVWDYTVFCPNGV